ncbi:TetR/AcrR family transcriptional regulator [Solimonas sp. K1W22B-7]|uniref:TetR/AcrR family transcriptional regulator n=1 Tax=Solimonas sp. K1W22B-7 TaxID=2303331 RepID=UPI000E337769|nr:TetR/AcrR family transcriptional regulator [Solimonas sp. K1W22B-7]AXQ30050.1 TetR/AcrR family transcriptional regulator [Solimonas sp. K1W22B-7]
MNTQIVVEPSSTKAERTRAAILATAEDLFSRQGYAATRLEDVAEALGLTRAALFYYYGDKQKLYDAMLAEAFSGLACHLEEVLAAETGSVVERIELAVEAWIDAIIARPTLARLILRFVADGAEQPSQAIFSDNNRLPMQFWALFEQGRRSGELKPVNDDPFHTASAVIGTTVFYVGALSGLVPHGQFQPLDPKQVADHKREALFATRHLLGIGKGGRRKAVKKQ